MTQPLRGFGPLLVALGLLASCGRSGGLPLLVGPDAGPDATVGPDDGNPPPPDAAPPQPLDAAPDPDALVSPDTRPMPGEADAASPSEVGVPVCVPGQSVGCGCADGRNGAQLCNAAGQFAPCRCEDDRLARLRKGVVGPWTGQVTTPWQPPYQVTMTFEADGRYSAHCIAMRDNCTALYWGRDDDTPEKRYDIQDIRADGKGVAEILIWFEAGNITRGQLRNMELSADGDRLTFEAWNRDYGPLNFVLRRAQ